MPRKKTADKPVSSTSETAVATQTPASKSTRAPGSSSQAVTHKHKKAAVAAIAEVAVEVAVATASFQPPTKAEIAIHAYFLAQSRGFQGGSTEEDWLSAERELSAPRLPK